MGVRISIAGPGHAEPLDCAFEHLPIRLGRNPLNELVLEDPHVSQWHAVINFLEGALRIIDVGSRNGTQIEGRRLRAGEAVPLRGGERIDIGPFSIRTMAAGGAEQPRATGKVSARSGTPALGVQTVAYGLGASDEIAQAARAAAAQAAVPVPVPVPVPDESLHAELKPLYLAYLRDWAALSERVRTLGQGWSAAERTRILAGLRDAFPVHLWEQEFPELASAGHELATAGAPGQQALAPRAVLVLRQLASHLAGRALALDSPAEIDAFATHLGAVIDVLLSCTHSLLKGLERLESDMAIKILDEAASPLVRAHSPSDLGARLFDPRADAQGQAPQALASAFKSLMIQQVALLSGAMEGVRTLLEHLAPKTLEQELLEKGVGLGPLVRTARLWRAYEAKHERLAEEDHETFEAIFGPQFALAYTEIMGQSYRVKR